MTIDASGLKYVGTQSHETMAMDAALAERDAHATPDGLVHYNLHTEESGSKLADAAGWVGDKASDAAHGAARHVQKRARRAVGEFAQDDPIKAILVSAATGAILMILITVVARYGARSVTRRFGANT